jgi:hypothetical protein
VGSSKESVLFSKSNFSTSSSCTNLHSHHQRMRFLFSPHPCQHLLLFVFFMIVILTGVKWNLYSVLICISFNAFFFEHFFMCYFAIWTSSFDKALFSLFVPISIGHWFFGSSAFSAPCIFWLLIPYKMYSCHRFSPFRGCHFNSVTISFVMQKLFSFTDDIFFPSAFPTHFSLWKPQVQPLSYMESVQVEPVNSLLEDI